MGLAKALLHPAAKPVVFVLSLLPFAWLFYGALTNNLGANPAEYLTRATGDWTLRFLCLTLAVTPVTVQPAQEKARWGSQLTLRNGTFWYASDGGMLRLDRTYDHFEPVPGVDNRQAVDAFDFTDDGLWMARPDGLEHYHYASGS